MFLLNASDVAVALQRCDQMVALGELEAAVLKAAQIVAEKTNTTVRALDRFGMTQDGFGGLCVGFTPNWLGQPMPVEFIGLDTEEEWGRHWPW